MTSRFYRPLAAISMAIALAACSQPTDIVFGSDPLKTMSENVELVRKLPDQDRDLLARYLMAREASAALGMPNIEGGPDRTPLVGKTVGEAIELARLWETKRKALAEARAVQEAKEADLRKRAQAERKAILDQLTESATVTLLEKRVVERDFREARPFDLLVLKFGLENKSKQAIVQLKGVVYVTDAVGDEVGSLLVDFDDRLEPGKVVQTDRGSAWHVTRTGRDYIERIADANGSTIKSRFEIESIAFADGTVVRAPEVD
ncbi:hypothetical protein [Caenimonas sp. SL110]|uniref:hypothetical protein n=1 Tax=Caenimonas sp. SL110 TaxID=1450524 RepID=UPI000653F491|nr:hypothetical protein [Caenimonas sp. SL110]